MRTLVTMFGTVLSSLVISSLASASSSVCESRASMQKIAALAANHSTDLTITTFANVVHTARITFIGDEHFNTSINAMRSLIAGYAKVKGPHACVAFEMPIVAASAALYIDQHEADYQRAISQLNAMKKTKGITVQGAREIDQGIAQAQNDINQYSSYFRPLVNQAAASGLKSYAVDTPENEVHEVSLDKRNLAMAKNIGALIEKSGCSDVLMFVGKAHLVKSQGESSDLKSLSKSFYPEYPALTFNLQMTQETVSPMARTFLTCEPVLGGKAIIFKSGSVFDSGPTVMPTQADMPMLSKFDFTILLP